MFFCYQDRTDVTAAAALSRRQLGESLSLQKSGGNPTGATLCSHLANVKHRMNKQWVLLSNAGLGKLHTLLCACLSLFFSKRKYLSFIFKLRQVCFEVVIMTCREHMLKLQLLILRPPQTKPSWNL